MTGCISPVLRRLTVALLGKPDGGLRPVALFEEVMKTVETIVSVRIEAARYADGIGGLLSAGKLHGRVGSKLLAFLL